MKRVPVTIDTRGWVPSGSAAWVPAKRLIRVRPEHARDVRLMAHELQHVLQAETRVWPAAYVWQWIRYGFSYQRMPFEVEARRASRDPVMLSWAEDIIARS